MIPIISFKEEYRFLSNFWSCGVWWHEEMYNSVEHAYQAEKMLRIEDHRKVSHAMTAGEAKKLGRRYKAKPHWDEIKLRVMEELVMSKFASNEDLKAKLLATGDATLIEGNHWGDIYWGVCKGDGENHLGLILMKVRSKLRERP